MNIQQKLVIATGNLGKAAEILGLFRDVPFTLQTLRDFQNIIEVEESGSTFEENAILKARGYSVQTGNLTLADDSGLEIAALDGSPGILSARYAGADTAYREKIDLLLNELQATGNRNRAARFVCSMALADEAGEILATGTGICVGTIAREPAGENGFGYDPIFIPTGFAETFGQLSDDIKQQISHRARASVKILRYLHGFRAV